MTKRIKKGDNNKDTLTYSITGKFEEGSVIANGEYGRITEAKWEGLTVAVKTIHSILYKQVDEEEFLKYCEELSALRHSNIVQFFGTYPNNPPGLVMERLYCNLDELLSKNVVLSYATKTSILYQISLGLRYLHTRNPIIIHRDLSSKNILMSENMEAKISNVGLAKLLFPNPKVTKEGGIMNFLAPEALHTGYDPSPPSDIFSFGCIALHTYTQEFPKATQPPTYIDQSKNILIPLPEVFRNQCIDELKNNKAVKEEIVDLIKCCINNDAHKRPSSTIISDGLEKILPHKYKVVTAGTCAASPHLQFYEGLDIASTKNIEQWKRWKPKWQRCTNFRLPQKCWVTSVAELNEKIYISVLIDNNNPVPIPHVYDCRENRWDSLSTLPFNISNFSLVAVKQINSILAIGGETTNQISDQVFTWNGINWSNDLPSMNRARYRSSAVSHDALVIVAGGIINQQPETSTKEVEVLLLTDHNLKWHRVESLPHVVYGAIPLIIENSVYIAVGYDGQVHVNNRLDSTCNIVKAYIPDLLGNNNESINNGSVWKKLTDMPYSSWSFNYYKNNLIAFTGDSFVQPSEKSMLICQNVPLIYIYNPSTYLWDCVDNLNGSTIDHYLGCSIHVNANTILFLGGISGRHEGVEDLVDSCYTLTFEP